MEGKGLRVLGAQLRDENGTIIGHMAITKREKGGTSARDLLRKGKVSQQELEEHWTSTVPTVRGQPLRCFDGCRHSHHQTMSSSIQTFRRPLRQRR